MKPLSAKHKAWAERHVADGPLRHVAAPAWRALLAVERTLCALADGRPDSGQVGDVTAIIKTFERPRRCAALIAGIRRRYPDLRIIVADDSSEPGAWPGTTVVRLPYDVGVSAGRQAALDKVETEFVLNLDDDFLVCSATRVAGAAAILREHRQIDVLGGVVVDLPLFITHDFRGANLHPTTRRSRLAPGTLIGPAEVMDKVANFFIARASAVRAIGWDPKLRRLDHADFFTRAKGRLVSAQWSGWKILHQRDPFDRAYRRFRDDLAADRLALFNRYCRPGDSGRDRGQPRSRR